MDALLVQQFKVQFITFAAVVELIGAESDIKPFILKVVLIQITGHWRKGRFGPCGNGTTG